MGLEKLRENIVGGERGIEAARWRSTSRLYITTREDHTNTVILPNL
jgi:hypothetical protein